MHLPGKHEKHAWPNRSSKLLLSLALKQNQCQFKLRKSHCERKQNRTEHKIRGRDFYNQIRTRLWLQPLVPTGCWPRLFSFGKLQMLSWHCFLLFFMIIYIHQLCIDLVPATTSPPPPSKQRKDENFYIYIFLAWQKPMNSDVLTLAVPFYQLLTNL